MPSTLSKIVFGGAFLSAASYLTYLICTQPKIVRPSSTTHEMPIQSKPIVIHVESDVLDGNPEQQPKGKEETNEEWLLRIIQEESKDLGNYVLSSDVDVSGLAQACEDIPEEEVRAVVKAALAVALNDRLSAMDMKTDALGEILVKEPHFHSAIIQRAAASANIPVISPEQFGKMEPEEQLQVIVDVASLTNSELDAVVFDMNKAAAATEAQEEKQEQQEAEADQEHKAEIL